MNVRLRIIMGFFTVLLLIACSTQELQKFTYNTGAAVACRHANDNLPNEKELDFECLNSQAADEMSYDAYIELKNELEKHTKHTGSRSIRGPKHTGSGLPFPT